MKLKDWYPSYLISIGLAAGHWPSWGLAIGTIGLIGWVFYFCPDWAQCPVCKTTHYRSP